MEKLVRDNIPDIIEAKKGYKPMFRIADSSEIQRLMRNKLREELTELGYAMEDEPIENIIDEIADVGQVLKDSGLEVNLSSRLAEARRLEKLQERGGFTRRIVMESTEIG